MGKVSGGPVARLNSNEGETEAVWSTLAENSSRSDRGAIRRCWDPLAHPELGVHGCRTVYEALRRGCKVNPLGPCMGYRAVSTTGFATPFIYSSYTECVARVDAIAAGLDRLQLVPPNGDSAYGEGLKVIGLYLKNCMEWVLTEHACYAIGGVTAPFYDTLGPETVEFILTQTNAKSVVASRSELDKLCQVKQTGKCPKFTHAILIDGVTPQAAKLAQASGIEVISLAKVEAMGAEHIATFGHHTHSPPAPDDLATFCYTSGTTGDNPKGALLTHQNLVSVVAGIIRAISDFETYPYDRHLSYLPLAHIMERVAMVNMLVSGGSVAFYRGDPQLLVEDLQACRPTLFPAAPRVLNKIHDKIMAGMAATGGMKKKIFDAALAAKTEGLKRGTLKHALFDKLIFNKIKHGLGLDHVRFMLSGSAPLSENVMTFFRCMMGVPVVEGYGQTEGAAGCAISHPQDIATVGHVGGPIGCVEVVLVDVPEMGYFHTDTLHRSGQPCRGRGEICIRGPNVFVGYYKDEVNTKETIDAEGWLHSGDIGLWRPDGSLQIIDRKKNIFKLSQGEYVAPEKIENIILRSPLIAQCFVHGDSLQSSLVAIVVPDEDHVRHWAATNEPALSSSFDQLCRSARLKEAILQDIQQLSRENGLHGFEIVRAIYVDHVPFSVERDMMTPTFKLKRSKVRDAYEPQIRQLYETMPPPSHSKL